MRTHQVQFILIDPGVDPLAISGLAIKSRDAGVYTAETNDEGLAEIERLSAAGQIAAATPED